MKSINIANLVKKIGIDAAVYKLSSGEFSISELRQIAKCHNVILDKKITRLSIAVEIINSKSKMINKSHDDLLSMDQQELSKYLESSKASRKEIIQLLSDFGIVPSGKDREHNLVDFASRELSSLGVYKRVASGYGIRNRLRDRVLENFPYCIYCGGETPADTCDHCPPISLFDDRQRPEGLEFPACGACNSGAAKIESDMIFISRIHSNVETDAQINKLIEYRDQAIEQEKKKNPESLKLIKEIMYSSKSDQKNKINEKFAGKYRAVNIEGPRARKIVRAFTAKMGYALHFHLMKELYDENRPVSPSGVVYPFYISTNAHFLGSNFFNPMEQLVKLLGPPKTLRQGKKIAGDQFCYKGREVTEGGLVTIHRVTIRQSLDIYALVCEREEGADTLKKCVVALNKQDLIVPGKPFRPGFLKKDRKA